MIEVIVVWLALAYWCAVIAKSNKRSEGLAFVMGLLLGIFAVIAYAIMGKTKEVKAQELQDLIDSRVNKN